MVICKKSVIIVIHVYAALCAALLRMKAGKRLSRREGTLVRKGESNVRLRHWN